MSVQLTKEETRFIIGNGLPDNENEIIALLWEYWSKTNTPIVNLFERAKQIRENGCRFEKEW